MTQEPLVPDDFDVPRVLRSARFRLEPLGPQHNVADLNAWTTSVDHIRATPGFEGRSWPPDSGLSAEGNLVDLVRHADEFDRRVAFAYTVLRPEDDDVIGCLYLDPGPRPGSIDVRSWVRADSADLDPVLRREVRQWLTHVWPFDEVAYAG
ncbi:twin-arginine translocation pathway signal protein [Mycobacterium sp. AT1]|uniref:twin-arginine translocation pathway signal protein n=1 Tax=Mycobacterium sp. AT1 TaxID=1961706 RepID=UPI0009AF0220|nr:twin-arginine translocation pathway signal protein [Mycobacterium sp. AT1]OPX11327.1 twin-arginine translocation pathway signal protein [Mycobacterium sp. AT1]